jgi:hypothetical protein
VSTPEQSVGCFAIGIRDVLDRPYLLSPLVGWCYGSRREYERQPFVVPCRWTTQVTIGRHALAARWRISSWQGIGLRRTERIAPAPATGDIR